MSVVPFSFFSGALYSRKVCQVYLPPSYKEQQERRYPIIYLLHGMNGDETSWNVKGKAEATLDTMIASGELSECIVVMPNDGGYSHGTFYVNWYDGSGQFEDYMLYDLIPAIEREFRVQDDRARRAVCGMSMGGFGAFSLALRYPQLFGSAASISGALMSAKAMPLDQARSYEAQRMIGPLHGPYALDYDLHLLATRRVTEALQPALHFNCGKLDYLYPVNQAYKALLDHLKYSQYEFMEFEGDHTWSYFGEHLTEALQFIERSFQTEAALI